ncbi:MAG: Crp/Fnr family transcriptional regulator [Burkholderiales bacterium]
MNSTPEISSFRLAPLFRELDRELLAQIAQHARWRELQAGEQLFAKGDTGKHFFLVKTGVIKLFLTSEDGEEHITEIVGREQLFAEAVMFMGDTYPVYASALEASRLIAFDARFFATLLRANSDLCLKLLAALSRQLHALVAEIDGLTLHSGTRRLARYLLAQPAKKTASGRVVELPIAKQALASLLDLRPETLSRILNKLTEDGLIAMDADCITLIQSVALSRI